ncbi:MAG TPA: SpoIID/LytB domain-containing protein [Candidatus Sulfotelmatobacter sp.]|nr:SpoIID/LytB domain-containing protein [Candidatus Sulfotelmatobacter sp.]
MQTDCRGFLRLPVRLIGFVAICVAFTSGPPAVQSFDGTEIRPQVRIGVLGLFHPRELTVRAMDGHAIVLRAGDQAATLETSSGLNVAKVTLIDSSLSLKAGTRSVVGPKVTVSDRSGEPGDFILGVPGKLSRHYRGSLEIKPSGGQLIAVVTMDREMAVASIVAAESAPGAPLEALKAQAVAVRSYLVSSHGRHTQFDFCDTTHCQFLREAPAATSAAARATAATKGLVLAYNTEPFAAMYTRSCSGHTRTPAQEGLHRGTYPYYSVECSHCIAHPARWTARLSTADAAGLRASDESARLRVTRRLGWGSVPSSDFVAKKNGNQIVLQGSGYGHGIGLCQAGARAMAESGASFQEILNHYYPNTEIVRLKAIQAWTGAWQPVARHRLIRFNTNKSDIVDPN